MLLVLSLLQQLCMHTHAYSYNYCEGNHESEACLKIAIVQYIRESIGDVFCT